MLLAACEKNDIDRITDLISKREDLEQRDKQGFTPLLIAAKTGHIQTISTLLKAGSKIEALNNARQTPLFVACWSGHEEAVKYLITKGANINHQDKRGWTPLIISVYQDLENIVKILLDRGCDPEKTDCFNKQAIDRAKSIKMMEMLKKAVSEKRKLNRKSSLNEISKRTPNSTPRSSRSETKSMDFPSPKNAKKSEIDFKLRKSIKEKIDKRVRDYFFDEKRNFCGNFSQVFVNVLEDEKTKVAEGIRNRVQEMVKSKTWDLFGKLKAFCDNNLMKARPKKEKKVKTEEKIETVEVPKNELMKNRIRSSIKEEIKKSLNFEKSELEGFITSYVEKEFYRLGQRENPEQVKNFKEQKRKVLSLVPQFDVGSSLKGFMSSETSGNKSEENLKFPRIIESG